MMAAGLRATAKAVEHPPEPKIGAPVLDPTSMGELIDLLPQPIHGGFAQDPVD
jgi:hypothetical protein